MKHELDNIDNAITCVALLKYIKELISKIDKAEQQIETLKSTKEGAVLVQKEILEQRRQALAKDLAQADFEYGVNEWKEKLKTKRSRGRPKGSKNKIKVTSK
jgi:hypothetical protein